MALIESMLDAALAVVLAPVCAACDELLDHPTGGPVCAGCWDALVPLTPPLCDRCGDVLPTWRPASLSNARCARCRRTPRAIDRGRAVGAYDGRLRAIIHAFKYEGRRSLARPLACLMRSRCADLLQGADFCVPVPLHRARRRLRGFNQAEDLARHLGLPARNVLRRVRPTRTQTELPAGQRHRNVRGAFAMDPRAAHLDGRIVVLVDDVSTTGATLDACAKVLKTRGVAEVRALTAARVVAPPD